MTRETVLASLREIYAEELEYPVEILTEEAGLELDLGVDSLTRAELLIRAGKHFGIPDGAVLALQPGRTRTLGAIADRLHELTAAAVG